MEAIYSQLTERARRLLASKQHCHPAERTLILIAGPPGSGKSTVADQVVRRLNTVSAPPSPAPTSRGSEATPLAVVVRMDGYHFTRAQLNTFHNAREAHARRGAAWTFDAAAVLGLFEQLGSSLHSENCHGAVIRSDNADIYVPTFDHAIKDPVADGAVICRDTALVIMEGNWLLYDEEPWRQFSTLVDESWFIDVDANVARRRIAQRHLESGIESTLEAALARVDSNDLPNGEEVRTKLVTPTVRVLSVDESS
ncbi:P-loop containing nucleoside triphosphate hydrolase protein [Microdochium trichocladiopsis]|uniref:P-loop containing nucleoside triphosphate hydrolase protein n=1 Tax=Microdochium trichocladiopsis TaxID=1682393 RepID=A0A9P8Y4N0_9PEZI|nr:P-loop containing nucleoside triphosphate hydrolase protein [Microdochium trichocladiopsis]KAH7029492.1 P-loop containing nucleoside triphosphate hydrolase protein [Microdochium trichocladiopsis]